MFLKKHLFIAIAVVCALTSVALSEVNELQAPHDATNAMACASCHVPYNTVPQPVPENWLTTSVCQSCHTSGGVASNMKTHVANADTVWCQTCHDPHMHQTTYPRWYVKNQIITPNSGARPSVIRDSLDLMHGATGVVQPYDGVCETCHTTTPIFRNNASGLHPTTAALMTHEGSDKCTNCHQHKNGFQSSTSANTCFACHSASTNSVRDTSLHYTASNMYSRFDTLRTTSHPVRKLYDNGRFVFAKVEGNAAITTKLLRTPSWFSGTSLTSSSMITCTDCHGDSAATASKGMHGLSYPMMEETTAVALQLRASLRLGMNQEYGPNYDLTGNALCYACHTPEYYRLSASARPTGFMRSDSNRWSRHYSHVVYHNANTQERQENCVTCHGVHGGATTAQDTTFPINRAYGRTGLIRWSKQATGLVFEHGQTGPDSITVPDSTLKTALTGGSPQIATGYKSAAYGYFKFKNKTYDRTIPPLLQTMWNLRDTAIVNVAGDTIADYYLGFCYVNCHTGKDLPMVAGDTVGTKHPNNHYGRSVSYRIWR
ncbi:MAG: hypothetical protein OEM52_00375 [bacterium]|nr:hypothetical protein [bacterium]